ncbi:crotonase/enoyl-CoA hydratase family protein [Aeromicrobium sp.]|uniref:crotonase/enoyl-CoA hydratase family protein n=1 Tax=Aeromicrobium sp. TaxID=1871063 RepID=UPI0030BF6C05
MTVSVERHGAVTLIGIDRPDVRNAVDGPTALALADAFRDFDADDTAAVAVLFGHGGTFCAGADLKALATDRRNRLDDEGDGPMGPTRMRLGKPVIAAIEGHAVAGGLELALWADLRVVAESATFGVFCRRWGVPLIDGGTVRLPRLVGESRAMDLILTGRPVDASEAERIGLANRVVPDGTAVDAARELAQSLIDFPQDCMRSDRQSVLDQAGRSEADAMAIEFGHGRAAIGSEMLQGAARFADGAGRHGTFRDAPA